MLSPFRSRGSPPTRCSASRRLTGVTARKSPKSSRTPEKSSFTRLAIQAPPTRGNMPTNCASAIRLRSIARLRRKATALRFSFTSVMSSTISAKRNTTTTNFTTPSATTPLPFLRFREITIHSWFRERRQATRRWTRSSEHVITPEAGSLHRTAMTQPGVYFTLDAPFVRIIGLFSNALEDPGVISNLDHNWAAVSNVQIDFLRAQLKRIKQEKYPGAVLLATHHPPYSYSPPAKSGGAGGNHGCSTVMLEQIDKI